MTVERWRQVREVLYAASAQDTDARARFLDENCVGDAELRSEVERLLGALNDSGGFLEPGEPAVRESPDRESADRAPLDKKIGPYLILDPAGEGGMGTVYRAIRDDDYRQQVAVKLVRREAETSALLQRFRQERQALALLNHPNIARLFDGGTTQAGRPYLVMEWVDGATITAYCAKERLPARRRLELFLSICEAVAHAHGNLVVHRDLKPSNILITPEGIPKLLDFGIAKMLSPEHDGDAATLMLSGTRALTPDYASPEQVRGEPITTATDIYSLGAVLYELLTGKRPHHFETRTVPEIERVVCTQEIPRPSSVAAITEIPANELRGDLDNIILKALEAEPARRYSHVEALAADIRAYLEGRPIAARGGAFWYRTGKFIRRNRLLAGAAAAVLAALTIGLGVSLWEARAARRERVASDRRFELARRVAGSLLYDVHDAIEDLAGSSKARELLLRRSLEYLDALSKESSSNPGLQRDLANAYQRAASLQGGSGTSNLGDTQAARQSLNHAVALLENALRSDPHSLAIRRDLARMHREFVYLNGDGQEALRHAQASLGLVEALRRENPGDRALLGDLQLSEYAMARSLTKVQGYPEAIAYYRRLLSHVEGAVPANLALYHKSLGALLGQAGALDEALAEYKAAAALDEQRVRDEPANGRANLDLSYDYADWGFILTKSNHLAPAVEQYRKAQQIRVAMAAADPRDARAAHALVSVEFRYGIALARAGDRAAAGQAFQRTVRAGEALIANFPDKKPSTRALAEAFWNIGNSYRDIWASCGLARPWYNRALELYRGINESTSIIDTAIAGCAAR
jgi:tetratricopeptide (TPR) repeat protein